MIKLLRVLCKIRFRHNPKKNSPRSSTLTEITVRGHTTSGTYPSIISTCIIKNLRESQRMKNNLNFNRN